MRSSHQIYGLEKSDPKLLPTLVKYIFGYETTVRHAAGPRYKNSKRQLQGTNKRVNKVTF